jgi:hypothetical protein
MKTPVFLMHDCRRVEDVEFARTVEDVMVISNSSVSSNS